MEREHMANGRFHMYDYRLKGEDAEGDSLVFGAQGPGADMVRVENVGSNQVGRVKWNRTYMIIST